MGRIPPVGGVTRETLDLDVALGAIALPRFVLSFAGRRRMVVASFFAWPMVQNWFVSMGMLDFAMGIPLATLLLVALNAQRQRTSVARSVATSQRQMVPVSCRLILRR